MPKPHSLAQVASDGESFGFGEDTPAEPMVKFSMDNPQDVTCLPSRKLLIRTFLKLMSAQPTYS